jgi:hypothetical protein
MSRERSDIDRIGLELHERAQAFAERAEALASDPYFREAVLKVSVSSFVWALYDAFSDPSDRPALDSELKVQSAAVSRALGAAEEAKFDA